MKQNQNTLHTQKVILNDKAFFLDLREAKNGKKYLVITQTKPIEDQRYERIKMILFENEIQKFSLALNALLENFTPKEIVQAPVTDAHIAKIRQSHPKAYQPWTKEEEEVLIAFFNEDKPIPEIASTMQRQEGAITARLIKLGLIQQASAA